MNMNKSTHHLKAINFSMPGSTLLRAVFLLFGFLLFSGTAIAQNNGQKTYYWRGQGKTPDSWTDPKNWGLNRTGTVTSPNDRNPIANDDILVFDPTVEVLNGVFPASIKVDVGQGNQGTAAYSETIGQLRIIGGANVKLTGPTTANDGSVLNISGGSAAAGLDDLFVDATSTLTINSSGNTNNRFLLIRVGAGKKGRILGNIDFNANPGTPTRLVAVGASSLVFSGAGSFSATSVSGSPFGTTGANTLLSVNGNALPAGFTDVTTAHSVVFETGAKFTQKDGLDPFSNGSTPVTDFKSGSVYTYNGGSFSPQGQTYGNLEFAGAGTIPTVSGTQQMVVVNNLTMTSGTANLNLTGTGTGTAAAFSLGGNLNANGGILNFLPTSASTVAFNSPISPATTAVAQTISGAGTLNFNSPTILEINNDAGLTLNRAVTESGGLRLTLGLITTLAPNNLLTLPSTAIITGGSSSNANGVGGSFVNGPVARSTTGSVTDLSFPVGKVGAPRATAPGGLKVYRPMGLSTTNQTSATTYVGEQKETPPTQNVAPGIDHVSFKRYYTLTPTTGQPTGTGFNAVVTLSFGAEDYVTNPNAASFVIAKRDLPGAWDNYGHGTATSGTLSSSVPITSFSDFSLASTVASTGPVPGLNPLPVELTRFTASAQGNGVNLSWATAQEKNNDRFDVQRSADGSEFATIGTVKGQGNSTSAHEYAFADGRPLAGLSYYRLRQVDQDGTSTFSPVAAVQLKHAGDLAYPNPSNGLITLTASLGAVEYRIVNNLGQSLLRGHATGNDRLDLAPLPKGIYFLELTGQSSHSTQRLVRE